MSNVPTPEEFLKELNNEVDKSSDNSTFYSRIRNALQQAYAIASTADCNMYQLSELIFIEKVLLEVNTNYDKFYNSLDTDSK